MIFKSTNKDNTHQKGFTLIELLIVIAIIGALATMVVISLVGEQKKARDAKRLSDINQLSTILEITEVNSPSSGTIKNGAADCATDSKTIDCDGPDMINQFYKFKDPSAKGIGAACHDLTAGNDGVCDYSISNEAGAGPAKTDDYIICFYTETTSIAGPSGMYHIKTNGMVDKDDAPCP